jgi:hypothetical protein
MHDTLCPVPSSLYPLPYTLCPVPSSLHPLPYYTLCPIPSVQNPPPFTLCPIPSALCPVPSSLYPPLFILCFLHPGLCPLPSALFAFWTQLSLLPLCVTPTYPLKESMGCSQKQRIINVANLEVSSRNKHFCQELNEFFILSVYVVLSSSFISEGFPSQGNAYIYIHFT